MKLFLFVKLFFLINFAYAVSKGGESSSRKIDITVDLSIVQNSDCSCRLGSNKKIVNGKVAEPHLVPWQVSLANSTRYHFCGAVIINHFYILTSANCVEGKLEEEIKVRVGLHNINDPIPIEKTYDVEQIDGFEFTTIPGGHTSPKIEDTEKKLITFGTLSPVLKIAYLNEYRTPFMENLIRATSLNGDSPCIADNGGPLHSTREGLTVVEGVLLDLVPEFRPIKIFCNGNSIFSRLSFYKEWIEAEIGKNYCTKDQALKSESKRKLESIHDLKGKKELRLN